MAVILLADCTVTNDPQVGLNAYKIVTPSSASNGDTIDVSELVAASEIVAASAQAATDGWLPVAAIDTAGVLTIPGSTGSEARTIHVIGRL